MSGVEDMSSTTMSRGSEVVLKIEGGTVSDLLPGVTTDIGLRTLGSYNRIYLFSRNVYTNSIPRTLPVKWNLINRLRTYTNVLRIDIFSLYHPVNWCVPSLFSVHFPRPSLSLQHVTIETSISLSGLGSLRSRSTTFSVPLPNRDLGNIPFVGTVVELKSKHS